LVIVENENDIFNEGGAGEVEKVFDLTGQTLGSSGFLVFRQAGNSYTVAPGTTELTYSVPLENSGFTAMLILNNGGPGSVPFVSDVTPMDLDADNNGVLDVPNGNIDWDVIDSIGIHAEVDEPEFGQLYGAVNFGPLPSGTGVPNYLNVGYEIEYLGRWGNSTGSTHADWHVSNLTDNVLSGFIGPSDFRQSGDPHGVGAPGQIVETNQNVAYGTNLTNTLGAANYPLNILPPATTIAGRHIFYNQSVWDGNSAAISAVNDNAAIAPGKVPHLPGGGVAVAANITSFSRGINGIMVDLSTGVNHTGITAADFVFKVGNNNSPNLWAAAPAPSAISVIPGGGVGGADRVEITWASGVVKNQWLEVQVLPTVATGLAATDVHFWGNKIADSASSSPAGTFDTTSTDSAQVNATIGAGKPITDLRDYNRDGAVTSTDAAIVAANIGTIQRLSILVGGPFAPEADPAVASDDGSSAVASALAARSGPAGLPKLVDQIATPFVASKLNTSAIANVFSQWAADHPVQTRAVVSGIQQASEVLGVDDNLLDSLLDEIGLT
jgi:hypothetical protein